MPNSSNYRDIFVVCVCPFYEKKRLLKQIPTFKSNAPDFTKSILISLTSRYHHPLLKWVSTVSSGTTKRD